MINCFPVSVQKVKRALLEYPLSGAVNPGKDEEPEKKKNCQRKTDSCCTTPQRTEPNIDRRPLEMGQTFHDREGHKALEQVTEDYGTSLGNPRKHQSKGRIHVWPWAC